MPQRTTRMLRYSRALPDIRVEGKVTLRQVLQRLAVAVLGVALLAASANGSRAEDDAGAAAAFLVSLKDQAIEQVIYLGFTLEFLAEEANDLGSPY